LNGAACQVSTPRTRLGDSGERFAEQRLLESGWKILARKWRGVGGEVDLIADQGELIVLVEVKTRRGESHGRAEEAVSGAKCARLIQLGQQFIESDTEFENRFWRVDLIAITLDRNGRVARYSHIEDACLDE
jgi:putative endonuclease